MGSRSVTHTDGFAWVRGTISNPGAWSLVDPDGYRVLHVIRCTDETWSAVWDHGETLVAGASTSGEAMRAADNAARPCAHVVPDGSGDVVGCDLDRAPGSTRCTEHTT